MFDIVLPALYHIILCIHIVYIYIYIYYVSMYIHT